MKYFKHMCHSHQDEKLQEVIENFGPEGYGVYWLLVERIGVNLQDFNDFRKHSVKNWADFCKIRPTKLLKMVKFMSDPENFSQKESLIFSKVDQKSLLIKIPNLIKYRDEYSIKKTRISGQTPDNVQTNSGQTPDIVRRNQIRSDQNQSNSNITDQSSVLNTHSSNILAEDSEPDDDFKKFIEIKYREFTGKKLNFNNQTNIDAIKDLKKFPIEIITIASNITKSLGGKGLNYLLKVVQTEYQNPKNYYKSSEKIIHKCNPAGAAIHKFSLNSKKSKFSDPPAYGFYMCLGCKEKWPTFKDIP